MACFVGPIGDFPLNDDFSFGRTVFHLVEHNELVFDDWLAMTLIVQVVWGAVFCEIFGASFTVLRLSTLVLAAIGLFIFYKTLKQVHASKKQAGLLVTCLAFNPLFFLLSYSFMTDVPFLSGILLSVFYFLQYFKKEKFQHLLLATAAALLATFIRQLGFMLPIAFALTWWLWIAIHKKRITVKSLLVGAMPLLTHLVLYILYQQWFAQSQGIPDTYGTFNKLFNRLNQHHFFTDCFDRFGMLLIYVGLFLSPALLLIRGRINWSKHKWLLLLAGGIGIAASLKMINRFPSGNICYNLGLGPKLLKDGYFFMNVQPAVSPIVLQITAGIGAIFGVYLLLRILSISTLLFQKAQKLENASPVQLTRLFSLANILVYGGFLMLDTHFFDRYFLPLLPFFLILLVSDVPSTPTKTARQLFSCFMLAALILFSITATHDYLSWNRARWQALDYLTATKNIAPTKIDGGFEFNGWHKTQTERNENSMKSWWWVKEDDYIVTFGEMDGFNKIKAFPYDRWLSPAQDSILVLEKQ